MDTVQYRPIYQLYGHIICIYTIGRVWRDREKNVGAGRREKGGEEKGGERKCKDANSK